MAHTKSLKENQTVLTMDNHKSNVSLDAKDRRINIITLPSHTSNHTQLLDRTVFGTMKSYINSTADSWTIANPGKTVSIYNIVELTGKTWIKVATPENILSGF